MFRICPPVILAFAALNFAGALRAQVLVPNKSFEHLTVCPAYTGQVTLATPWWNCCMAGSDLYSDSCAVPGLDQGGRTGHNCMGQYLLCDGAPDCREYTEVQLLSPLDQNKTYCISFFVRRRGHPYRLAVDRVGAHFSMDTVQLSGTGSVLALVPQVESPAGVLLADTGWTEVSGTYTALGGEAYLTIGNFRDDANTITEVVLPASPFNSAYYFIDDVSVEQCAVHNGILESEAAPISVYPQPSHGPLHVRIAAAGTWSFQLIDLVGHAIALPAQRAADNNYLLDVSGMATGTYVLRGYSDSAKALRTVVVVE